MFEDFKAAADIRDRSIDARTRWQVLYARARESFAQLDDLRHENISQAPQAGTTSLEPRPEFDDTYRGAQDGLKHLFNCLEEVHKQSALIQDMDLKLMRWDKKMADTQSSENEMFGINPVPVVPWPSHSGSGSSHYTPERPMPGIVEQYFDRKGDIGILEEHLFHDIPEKKRQESSSRDLFRDQGRLLMPTDSEFEAKFAEETADCQQKLEVAKAELEVLAIACADAKYSIDATFYKPSRHQDAPSDSRTNEDMYGWLQGVSGNYEPSPATAPESIAGPDLDESIHELDPAETRRSLQMGLPADQKISPPPHPATGMPGSSYAVLSNERAKTSARAHTLPSFERFDRNAKTQVSGELVAMRHGSSDPIQNPLRRPLSRSLPEARPDHPCDVHSPHITSQSVSDFG